MKSSKLGITKGHRLSIYEVYERGTFSVKNGI